MVKEKELNQTLAAYYRDQQVSKDLAEAILYSIEAGGKRIRPLLLLMLLEGFGLELSESHYQVAAALEMIHTGSLIHDDLPAMDDDDYRRGRLTSHKQFDEATAILAGDSLFLDPFGLLAKAELPALVRLSLIAELSDGSGSRGMVAGQMLDMKGEGKQLQLEELRTIHANKTGRLLAFPFVAAGLIAELDDEALTLLRQAGEKIGLAFQIRDDILDVTADFDALGKTPKKDVAAEKSTYPSLLGLAASKDLLNESLDDAVRLLDQLAQQVTFSPEGIEEMIERLRLHG